MSGNIKWRWIEGRELNGDTGKHKQKKETRAKPVQAPEQKDKERMGDVGAPEWVMRDWMGVADRQNKELKQVVDKIARIGGERS